MRVPVKYKIITTLLFILIVIIPTVHAEPNPDMWVNDQIQDKSFSKIGDAWGSVTHQYGEFLPEMTNKDLTDFVKDDAPLSIQNWIQGLVKYLFHELFLNGKLLGSLILLTLFSVVLQTMQNAFESKAVNKVAYAVIYLVLITLALNSFRLAASYTTDAIEAMSHFMNALIPLILAIMASVGSITSLAFFHPIILFLIHTSGVLISKVILPLLFLSALLHIVSSLNEHYKATQLANLLRNAALTIMGVFLTIFLGVISVQGAATAIQDGIALKTAKFVTGNFIPVIGRMFTDAAGTVMSASMLLKNTIGLVGVVTVLAIALFPAIKVLVIGIIYKLAAAILQPVGGGPVITTLDLISKHIFYIFAALLVVTMMFFFAIVILVAASNLTLMVR
ncbi:stage III sporulation protein AE [Salirhabdus euzebyi]|uniref:Stage III sporulation protein AE n=1 Tax=Salirhabdus euzebyi TaxID=394506 RepID=A0A841Q6S4_9BACI|nr:stage III sporulation protein AE [Salirhabdus euzebyi]MBB6454229.1 stage III sporulation protein AE [Salirhabdus euzebyi]